MKIVDGAGKSYTESWRCGAKDAERLCCLFADYESCLPFNFSKLRVKAPSSMSQLKSGHQILSPASVLSLHKDSK
jgi:hypothetical protein